MSKEYLQENSDGAYLADNLLIYTVSTQGIQYAHLSANRDTSNYLRKPRQLMKRLY